MVHTTYPLQSVILVIAWSNEDGHRIDRVRCDDPHYGRNRVHNGNHKDVGHRSARLRD